MQICRYMCIFFLANMLRKDLLEETALYCSWITEMGMAKKVSVASAHGLDDRAVNGTSQTMSAKEQ